MEKRERENNTRFVSVMESQDTERAKREKKEKRKRGTEEGEKKRYGDVKNERKNRHTVISRVGLVRLRRDIRGLVSSSPGCESAYSTVLY